VAGFFRRNADQQRAGGEQGERIEAERGANFPGLRKDRHLIGRDQNTQSGGDRHLEQPGQDASLGRVVHRLGVTGRCSRCPDHADPRIE